MKKIVMCAPTYYQIEYEINPWMHINNDVDPKGAAAAYQQLKQTYTKLGVEILDIAPAKGLPDMIYTANLGFALTDKFVVANFRYPERRGESALAKKYFQDLKFEIFELPEGIFFEGEGDLLKTDDHRYFFGHGHRSMPEAKPYLNDFLSTTCIDLEVTNPYFYHLDTCFAPLSNSAVVINPVSFTPEGLKTIHAQFDTVIEASAADNAVLGCNLEVIDTTIVVGKGISPQLQDRFQEIGLTTATVDMREYLKGGGSVKCASLRIQS